MGPTTGFNSNGSVNFTSPISPFYAGNDGYQSGERVAPRQMEFPDSSHGFGMVLATIVWVVFIGMFWGLWSANYGRK